MVLFKTTQKGFLLNSCQKMYDERVKFKQLLLEIKKDYERTKRLNLKKQYQNLITSKWIKDFSQ